MKEYLKTLLPILGMVGFLLFVFWPVLTGGVFLNTGVVYSDLWLFNYPFKDWYRGMLLEGNLPFWTNLIGNGYPVFAELQVGALYPFHLLFFWLFPTPFAYHFNIFFHFVLGAVFTFAFCRVSLKQSRWASVLASLVYVMSGYQMTHVHQINILEVAAYFPLMFLVAERLVSTRRWSWAFVGALVFALQILAGYIELFFYTAILTAAFFVFIAFFFTGRAGGRKTSSTLVLLGFFILMYVLGVGMSSAQLLPTWELTQQSQRAEGLSLESASATVWPLDKLILFINPGAYDLYEPEPGYHPLVPTTVNIPALYGYVGLLTLVLAFVAVTLVRRRFVMVFGLFLIGAFVYGMGRSTQLFAILWEVVPGLKYFRFPVKILFFIEFCLAVLAGFGFDSLRDRIEGRKVGVRVVRLLSVVVLILIVVDLYFNNFRRVLKVVLAREWFAGHEVAGFLQEELDPLQYRFYSHGTNNLDYQTTRDLKHQKDYQNILPVDYNMIFRLPSNREWVALFLERQQNMNRMRTSLDPENGVLGIPRELKRSLDLQGVKFLVADLPIENEQLKLVKEVPFFEEVDHLAYFGGAQGVQTVRVPARATFVYENQSAFPRASFVSSYRVVEDGDEALALVLSQDFDPAREVVLEKRVESGASSFGTGSAEILQDDEVSLTVAVESDVDGFLVLSDTYYPGWRADLDGEPTQILRANYAFRAVSVPAGEHLVRFRFEPTHWRMGLWISGISLLFVFAGLGYTVFRRR